MNHHQDLEIPPSPIEITELINACSQVLNSHGMMILRRLVFAWERFKEGQFTPEELQSLCHNIQPNNLADFRKGCENYQAKLFGLKKPETEK